ncbi:MAG: GspH/FimT family pseudopilin [Planctomycetaceae bacterium]|nr:GspH/FimT family pseudopilin [Planctomycetaceae bacterium]MCA9018661.1 GspH/FimT family pseudopilin [Planctomycetaceae bacterium]
MPTENLRAARNGFTLVELMIVVLLLSILATVSLISTDSSGSLALDATARMLAADLQLARNHAIKFNTEYTVDFDLNAQTYEILHTGAGDLPVPKNNLAGTGVDADRYLKQIQVDSLNLPGQAVLRQIKLKTSTAAVSDLAFGPLGGTGPARNEDTVLMLTTQKNGNTFYILITVSWVTGQAWVDEIQTL